MFLYLFQVIYDFLSWLNAWEEKLNIGLISEKEFLTANTSEGLRVTLTSTIDLTTYLIRKRNFECVQTGRINQDPLEVHFN